MGKIVIAESLSLDGVVQDPGGIGSFKHKGWTFDVDRVEAGEQWKLPLGVLRYLLDEALGTKALLLGRVTYEEFATLWPARDGELADQLNSLPKYVVASRLENPEWSNSTLLSGDTVEEVSRLKRKLDGDIVVYGSIRLARTLIEHDLVDELRLLVYPVVLGAGERLFGALPDKKRVRLVDTKTLGGDGVAMLTYEPVRDAA
jgi:dihydrofolate reductase